MTHAMRYQLEQTSESATIYIAGGLAQHDVPALLALCDSLPSTVSTLRLDLRAVGCLSAEATAVIRRLLRHWEASRHGEFRLSTSHLMATYRPAEAGESAPMPVLSWGPMNEALAGTYL
jgi:hypothetical protein